MLHNCHLNTINVKKVILTSDSSLKIDNPNWEMSNPTPCTVVYTNDINEDGTVHFLGSLQIIMPTCVE